MEVAVLRLLGRDSLENDVSMENRACMTTPRETPYTGAPPLYITFEEHVTKQHARTILDWLFVRLVGELDSIEVVPDYGNSIYRHYKDLPALVWGNALSLLPTRCLGAAITVNFESELGVLITKLKCTNNLKFFKALSPEGVKASAFRGPYCSRSPKQVD